MLIIISNQQECLQGWVFEAMLMHSGSVGDLECDIDIISYIWLI